MKSHLWEDYTNLLSYTSYVLISQMAYVFQPGYVICLLFNHIWFYYLSNVSTRGTNSVS